MRKAILAVVLGMSMIACLSSCGLANTAGNSASGTAVSMGAATDAGVSGSAIKEQNVSGEAVEREESREPYCNSTNYYVDHGLQGIEQKTWDGKHVRTIVLKEDGYVELRYVTDREIFYTVTGNWDEPVPLWSIPIEKTENGDEPMPEKAEKVLVEEEDMIDGANEALPGDGIFYADENYIVYQSYYDIRVYDRRNKKFISLKGEPRDKMGVANNAISIADAMCDGRIFISTKSKGLYQYKLGTDKVLPVDKKVYGAASVITCDKKNTVYYWRWEDKKDSEENLWVYDCETGKRQIYLSQEKWHKAFVEAGLLPADSRVSDVDAIGDLYEDGGRLYNVVAREVFSCDLEKGTIQYERGLSNCLKDKNRNGEKYSVLTMIDGICLLENNQKDFWYYACYDFSREKQQWRELDKDAPERKYLGWIGAEARME